MLGSSFLDRSETPGKDAFLRMQPVFGLIETTDCGPSITSSVTSSPRWAGKQCMKIASLFAQAMSFALTW